MKGVHSSHGGADRVLVCHVILAIVLLSSVSAAWGIVIHVRPGGSDGNDGSTWALAKQTVQAGLNTALPGDEVWVAAGTYVEQITLRLGVGLYGGFAGSEIAREERNWIINVTVLDGNLGGTVVTAPEGATASTRIDGFTIRNGSASSGGGIYCYACSPTIANNTITSNDAAYGGGIYCYEASPIISDSIISGNSASEGGGIYCFSSSSPVISNSIISGNNAQYGGGVSCWYCSPTVADCIINGNSALYNGGGIDCGESSLAIANTTIVGNTAWDCGGGICCESNSSPLIANTIVAFNNSGIWNDPNFPGAPVLSHNCVYNPGGYNYLGLAPGVGDIQVDPLFANLPVGDYHLTPPSPCHDSGDNSVVQPGWLDMDGQPRILGLYVDIGVDEIYSDAPPVLICADLAVSARADCTAPCPDVVASVIDDCAPFPVITQIPPVGTPLPLGTTAVLVTLTDDCGRSISCTGTVTVADTTAPVRYGLGYIIITNDDFSCSARAEFPCPAVDNCALASCVCTPPSGSTFPVGTTIVSCTATDAAGNTATFDFQVIVVDDEPPVARCKDITKQLDADGNASVTPEEVDNGSSDNCGIAGRALTPDSWTNCTKGAQTVTLTVTDAAGNSSSCTATVTLVDVTPPVVTCADQTVSAGADCIAPCPDVVSGISDNCPGVTTAQSPPVGAALPLGTTTVTVTATDSSGNTASCTAVVTVVDTTPPVIDVYPPDRVLAADGTCHAVAPNLCAEVVAHDNCTPSGQLVCWQDPPPGTSMDAGASYTYKVWVRDAAATAISFTVTITVADTTPPTFTCPPDMTLVSPGCTVIGLDESLVLPYLMGANDNCPPPVGSYDGDPDVYCDWDFVSKTHKENANEPDVNVWIHWGADDHQDGCADIVDGLTLTSGVPPTVTGQPNLPAKPDCTWEGVGYMKAKDANGVVVLRFLWIHWQGGVMDKYEWREATEGLNQQEGEPLIGIPVSPGVNVIAWTVCDQAGNCSTCEQTVTVNCPPVCCFTYAPSHPDDQTPVQFTDCSTDPDGSVVGWYWDFGDGNTSNYQDPQNYFWVGTHTVCLTVTDNDGLTATCCQTITVTPSLTTISLTFQPGCWYLFSLPCDPENPDPAVVFPPEMPLDGNLTRYEAGGYIAYYSFDPDPFGPMKAGDGYWIFNPTADAITISYQAHCPTGAVELNYPYAGWYMMGNHQPRDVPIASCLVRNNVTSETLPFEQAWLAGWVQDPLFAYSCEELGYTTCGMDFSDQDDHLRQYSGYWFYTVQPNLTLVVP